MSSQFEKKLFDTFQVEIQVLVQVQGQGQGQVQGQIKGDFSKQLKQSNTSCRDNNVQRRIITNIPIPLIKLQLINNGDNYEFSSQGVSNKSIMFPYTKKKIPIKLIQCKKIQHQNSIMIKIEAYK